jgi:hypothetical protein
MVGARVVLVFGGWMMVVVVVMVMDLQLVNHDPECTARGSAI